MMAIQTVSEFTQEIKHLVEGHFGRVAVMGEISNMKRSSNGHLYVTVKDAGAQLPAVMWRGSAVSLNFEPEDGMQVIVHGALQVYPPHGKYQLVISRMEPVGVGELQAAFERLKRKLFEEGLFDAAHKRALPRFPERIGVITSATGAAFHDIRSTLEKRWPVAELVLLHSAVQGAGAAEQIAEGIEFFSEAAGGETDRGSADRASAGGEADGSGGVEDLSVSDGRVDVLIVGRGGGSLEDLWPFNEEVVARAIFRCRVPVISAVGHEIDVSISDYVADAKAATPTQAAVMATPDIQEMRYLIEDLSRVAEERVRGRLERWAQRVGRLAGSHALLRVREVLQIRRSGLERLTVSLSQHRADRVATGEKRLMELVHRLEKLDPKEPMRRGFSRVLQRGEWVRSSGAFLEGERFELEWADGRKSVESGS